MKKAEKRSGLYKGGRGPANSGKGPAPVMDDTPAITHHTRASRAGVCAWCLRPHVTVGAHIAMVPGRGRAAWECVGDRP